MHIVFGLALDHLHLPLPDQVEGNTLYVGPRALLHRLERFMGLPAPRENITHLRTEQYRQVIQQYLAKAEQPNFITNSFQADPMATAAYLLELRDELLLAGFHFDPIGEVPKRIELIGQLEKLRQDLQLTLPAGFADRWETMIRHLPLRKHPVQSLQVTDPPTTLPIHIKRLFDALSALGTTVTFPSWPPLMKGSSDLLIFQQSLLSPIKKIDARADGSLLVIRAKRDSDLATFWASLLKNNPGFRPFHLIPNKSRLLDFALQAEGLPCLGITAHSLARPSLQILKLIGLFLWEPLDPYALLAFLSLPLKPLNDHLAKNMAQLLAQQPGLNSDQWNAMIGQFLQYLEDHPPLEKDQSIQQYRFWFERQRYNPTEGAPVEQAIAIYQRLHHWARDLPSEHNDPNNLNLLVEQTRQMIELLENRTPKNISQLELEQLVRTIIEPASIQFAPPQVGMHPPVHHPHAITKPIDHLVWWNFIQYEPDYFFSRWYQNERTWLNSQQPAVKLETPAEANQRLVQFRKTAVWRTRKKLILVIPEIAEGQETLSHPLLGDLEATFIDLGPISIDIDQPGAETKMTPWLDPPQWHQHPLSGLRPPQPFIHTPDQQVIKPREKESITSLEDLFYYPYKWVFRHAAQWHPSPILSIVPEQTLLGNLAHRFVELIFATRPIQNWNQPDLNNWFDLNAGKLFTKEGSSLLLYGKEPQKLQFVNQLKSSVWNLIDLLQRNHWFEAQTEVDLQGHLGGLPITGRADLIAERANEQLIIDLKWRGASFRKNLIKNEEDLQLVLYTHMANVPERATYSAYYILSTGEMLARNNNPFPEIEPVVPDANIIEVHHRILDRMEATLKWRSQQLREGKIEVRCQATAEALQIAYENEPLLDVLEMKVDDAPFDEYRSLIGLMP